MEHPTYPNVLHALATVGARPVPVSMGPEPDGELGSGAVTAAVRDAAPRLAYLIPDFQNPTGAQLDAAGRQRLVELARRTGTTLLIDESLAELNLDVPRRAAGRRARGRRLAAGADRRLGEQDGLGRAAGGLDPDLGGHGPQAVRDPGVDGPGRSDPGPAGGRPGCWPTSSRSWPAAGSS